MPIYQIPDRVIIHEGKLPPFPADVEICAQLVPEELFGMSDLTGRLNIHPPGGEVQATVDMYHGGVRALPGKRLAMPSIATSLFGLGLVLEGNKATIRGCLDSEQSLYQSVNTVAAYLPGFLACALAGPVDIKHLSGKVGKTSFSVEVRGTFNYVFRSIDAEAVISAHMSALERLPDAIADRAFAAQRYINQSLWLGYVARYSQEFSGERLLNLYKAIEVLYPHYGEVDKLRCSLAGIGLKKDVVELFASIVYVRNSVDVGHAKIALMSAEEQRLFHLFLIYATELVTWLARYTVERLSTTNETVQSPNVAPSPISRTMEKVGELMKAINPLVPQSFFT